MKNCDKCGQALPRPKYVAEPDFSLEEYSGGNPKTPLIPGAWYVGYLHPTDKERGEKPWLGDKVGLNFYTGKAWARVTGYSFQERDIARL